VRIEAVNVYFVRPRWGFVEIITDTGLAGWGEAVLEGHAKAVLACVEEYRDYLIGKDPSRIEDIFSTIYRAGFYRSGGVMMSALSGIDQALWDIKGKVFNAPCHELMGGRCRDRMLVYSWIGGDRPGDTGRAAREKMEAGFKAIKMNATAELQMIDSYDKIDAALARVQEIRDACGKHFGIAIDFHGRVHKPMAKVLARKLEQFDPMFIEEPVLCEHMEEFREIAAMAEAYDVALAPHCPLGPIAFAACLQVDATCYNAVIQEQSIGIHYNVGRSVLDYVHNKEDFAFTDGYVNLPRLPGLGVDVNKALVLEENKTPHNWKNPVWRHKDGSVAEW